MGVGKCNSNVELLLTLCLENGFVVTNAISKSKDAHNNTWMHPRFKHRHTLNYIIVRQNDVDEVKDARAVRAVRADCAIDHVMPRFR